MRKECNISETANACKVDYLTFQKLSLAYSQFSFGTINGTNRLNDGYVSPLSPVFRSF